MDMNEKLTGVKLTKSCKVSADEDSKASAISVHLTVNFDGATVRDVFEKAMATTVIQWQTKARKHFTEYSNGQSVTIDFVAPARTTVDPLEAARSWFATASQEERDAYIAKLQGSAK